MRVHASTSEPVPVKPHAAAPFGIAAALWLAAVLSAPAHAEGADAGDLRGNIAAHLVRPHERGFASWNWPREPEVVALYFGADWCGPCHAFVPTLREVRDALQAAGADTEVVYISLDTSAADMRRYMRKQSMPWPAIDHRRLRQLTALRALGGTAPPNLVLVDREGRVIANAWDGHRYLGLQKVLKAWSEAFKRVGEHNVHA